MGGFHVNLYLFIYIVHTQKYIALGIILHNSESHESSRTRKVFSTDVLPQRKWKLSTCTCLIIYEDSESLKGYCLPAA